VNILEIIGLLTLVLSGVVLILYATGILKIGKVEIDRMESDADWLSAQDMTEFWQCHDDSVAQIRGAIEDAIKAITLYEWFIDEDHPRNSAPDDIRENLRKVLAENEVINSKK